MSAGVSPQQLQQLLNSDHPPLVIDVRRSAAYLADSEFFAGALRRDPDLVGLWADELPQASAVVAYCVHGHEASQGVAGALERVGISARYLEGGFDAWKAAGGGLSAKPTGASTRWVILNLEGVFSALLAWFAFKENFDRRVAMGMMFIVAGGVALSFGPELSAKGLVGETAIAGACLAWAIDNNLTRKVSLHDAMFIACAKGLVAGVTSVALALAYGARMPTVTIVLQAGLLGFFSYGLSLTLFVVALRNLGTARTGAYFSLAPFIGAALAVVLGAPLTATLVAAGLLMGAGVWLHLTEWHEHRHRHVLAEHEHQHTHDLHHPHRHDPEWDGKEPHTHAHVHESAEHTHTHYPDAHHRHRH